LLLISQRGTTLSKCKRDSNLRPHSKPSFLEALPLELKINIENKQKPSRTDSFHVVLETQKPLHGTCGRLVLPKPQKPLVETTIKCLISKSHNHWLKQPAKFFKNPKKNIFL
jgi:hypothetical protein